MIGIPYYAKSEVDALLAEIRRDYNLGGAGFRGYALTNTIVDIDGWWFAAEDGTYVNFNNLAVNLSNGISILLVEDNQSFFTQIVVPAMQVEEIPTSGSSKLVSSNGIFDALALNYSSLDNIKLDKSTYTGNAQDLKDDIDDVESFASSLNVSKVSSVVLGEPWGVASFSNIVTISGDNYTIAEAIGTLVETTHYIIESESTITLSAIQTQYLKRVFDDGGFVYSGSVPCINEALPPELNWDYYIRVYNDGGLVESLECVTI
jgi:hypothetical protein